MDEDIEDNNNKKEEKESFVPTDNTPRPPTGGVNDLIQFRISISAKCFGFEYHQAMIRSPSPGIFSMESLMKPSQNSSSSLLLRQPTASLTR